MKLTDMPGSNLRFAPLALGTAEFGSAITMERSFQIMDRFVEGGGTWIDTARVYADWLPDGHGKSEITVGRWLGDRGLRKDVLISTKGAHPDMSTMQVSRLGEQDIISDVEESLNCLGVDTIDLYWLHRDDESLPVDGILNTMNELVNTGKIRYFGCSNWRPNRIRAAAEYASNHELRSFVASQIQWSLAELNEDSGSDPTTVNMDKDGLEFYKETGLSMFAFTSQAKGFFQKLHAGGIESLKDAVKNSYYNEVNRGRMERVMEVSRQMNISISSVVLGYLISQPFPVVPIIGSSSVEQVEEAMEALDVRLTPGQVDYLEQG
ncbi:aldo/keto reductase [Paenibacillus monticola]|nr:aldo/keto reductase [Paenibacillus monticola]